MQVVCGRRLPGQDVVVVPLARTLPDVVVPDGREVTPGVRPGELPTSTRGPFWNYYGGKWRAAPLYPPPRHARVVEPFAGAAGYSLRYPDLDVVLVDSSPQVCETWRFLVGATRADVLGIPVVDSVDDLPASLPDGARLLVGWHMSTAVAMPCRNTSAGILKNRETGRSRYQGWTERTRARLAAQVHLVSHWRVLEGDFRETPGDEATWFVDPPYSGRGGRKYQRQVGCSYGELGDWCRQRRGQVIACEQAGATWLPFEPLASVKAGPGRADSAEVLWHRRQ